jgi:triacylglycerol esterase/lipase EstA (alpha/beta hydrolase family)
MDGMTRLFNDELVLRSCASSKLNDRTVVHWAASKGHAGILEDILTFCSRSKYLVNITEKITGWTALHVSLSPGVVQ